MVLALRLLLRRNLLQLVAYFSDPIPKYFFDYSQLGQYITSARVLNNDIVNNI